MKKSIKICLSIGALAAAVGCTDLDVDINSQYTEFPDSDIAAEAKMNDIYYAFRGGLSRRYNELVSLSSDEFSGVSFNGGYYDSGSNARATLHNTLASDEATDWYGDITGGIVKCNQAIVDLGGDEAPAAAPAIAMRAFYHFILMDCFGDTPILNHLLGADEAVDRAPRKEVAEFIESELLRVVDLLTTDVTPSTYGKPTAWMARALLVKLYINWAVYTCGDVATYEPSMANPKLNDCIRFCDEIIASGKFDLSNGYREKFFPENGPHIKDFIYAMPYDRITQQGMCYARYRTWKKANVPDVSYYGFKLESSVGGNFVVNPEMADLFTLKGDDRNEVVIGGTLYVYDSNRNKTSEVWLYEGAPVVVTKQLKLNPNYAKETLDVGEDLTGWSTGYKSIKWYPHHDDYLNGRNQSNDVPIFRYADILLTKAEAILRGGTATNGDTATSLMNQIRAYVHAPMVTGTPSLQDMLDERGREFFDENWRRNDLIRFGHFEDDWGLKHEIHPEAKTEKWRRIFPININVMNSNTNWKQNPGY